jgi:hypothetical protein
MNGSWMTNSNLEMLAGVPFFMKNYILEPAAIPHLGRNLGIQDPRMM